MRRRASLLLRIILPLAFVAALAATWLAPALTDEALGADDDQGTVASLLSWALSTPTSKVTVGSVSGALSSDVEVRDLRIADKDGVWLSVDRARLAWSRIALLSRRLDVDKLEIDRMTIARRPVGDESDAAQAADAPSLPELPVKLILRDFNLRELNLGQPVLGSAARVSATGQAVLGRPNEGLTLKLEARRLDAEGLASINLAYVPTSGQLDLAVLLKEPQGGLLATAGGLPGSPPIDLDLRGSGPIDNWQARLSFVSGPTVGAEGQMAVSREGAARRLALDLKARIEGLLPGALGPAFAGTTTAAGDVLVQDDGGFAFRRFEIASRMARLTLGGGVDAARNLDLALAIRAVPTDGAATKAGAASIGRLVLDIAAKGPADAPRVSGTLSGADIVGPAGRIGAIDGRLSIEPPAAQPGASAGVAAALSTLATDLKITGLAPADPALARATGDHVDLAARGVALSDFTFDVTNARLALATLDTTFTGKVGRRVLRGRAQARLPDLAAFSGLAGRPLGGSAALTADLDGNPRRYTIRAALDGQLKDGAIGVAAVDRLLAGTVTIHGNAERLPGGFGFSGLEIDGPSLKATLDGPATEDHADLRLTLLVPELKKADDRLSGRAMGHAKVTGTLERPDVAADLKLTDARSLGRPIPSLTLNVDATDVLGALDARATLAGELDRKPLDGRLRLARRGGGWALDDVDVTAGSVKLTGALALDADMVGQGRLTLAAGELDDISPLLLVPLKGDLAAEIGLTASGGRQDGTLQASSRRLDVAGFSLRRLDASVQASDVRARPVLDARVSADEVAVGGTRFDTIRFTSQGSPAASAFNLAAKGYGLDLSSKGRLLPGPPLGLELDALEARRGANRLALAEPARFSVDAGVVTIHKLAVAAGKGRLTVTGKAGQTLDLQAQATAVPLSVADIVSPGLGLEGTLDGRVDLSGPAAKPKGSYALQLARVSNAQARQAGVPPVDVKAKGALADGRVSVDASATAAGVGTLQVSGSAPLGPGDLDLKLRGPIDAAAANSVLAASGQRLTGRVVLDIAVGGPPAKPRLSGSAQLSGGTFEDVLNGISLKAVEGRFVAQGDRVTIERFSAATPNGGTLAASGSISIDPEAGFPADLRITGRKAQLVDSDVVSATADLDLTIQGPVARAPRIGGRIGILSMDIQIPERLPDTLAPLPGTRHVKPGPTARARLALMRAAQANGRRGPAFVATLDLSIEALNRIFVRGRGLQAELGGSLRLTGTTADPVAIGAFQLRNGGIDLAGQRIELVRGIVTFQGDLTPTLDFVAQTQAAEITAQVAISGRATEPSFAITSQPSLPQDEILSRILFQRAAGGLTGFQALQLAQTLAQLSGGGGGGLDQLRKSLGLDSLDISSGSSGGPTVGLTRYLGPKMRLNVRAGATASDTGLGVDYDLTKHIKLRGQVGANGSAAAGAAAEWEY
ncbi:MAG: translocation/assembly module TamB domain-containing protein [Alsobacter sp.]